MILQRVQLYDDPKERHKVLVLRFDPTSAEAKELFAELDRYLVEGSYTRFFHTLANQSLEVGGKAYTSRTSYAKPDVADTPPVPAGRRLVDLDK